MGRILIVDDEPMLVSLLQRYLERQGYQVDIAGSSQEAIIKFQAGPLEYALVVSDLTLPGMTGEALIAELRNYNPKLPGLIASGYPYEPQLKGVAFLQKPFLPQMLAEAIDKVLGPKGKARGSSA